MMRKRLSVMLVTLIPLGLASTALMAEGCGDYPLTQAQAYYLETQVPDIVVPEGNVPFVQRCDVDGNNVIDNNDLFAIREQRGQPAAHPDDPMDWDGNNVIHGRDVGGCASSCTANGCAVKNDAEEAEGLEAAMTEQNTAGASGACYQAADIDGDGSQDLVAIYEYTGSETRGNNWKLQVVILTEDIMGNVQHVAFPYTGQLTDGSSDLLQHLSLQPAGPVDLHPGSITIDGPGVVSYRNGQPKAIYYYDNNGDLAQAFYGIDD